MTGFTQDTAPTQYAEGGGIRFAYRRFGIPERPPLVFFQHFMGTLDDHDPAVSDAVASDREVMTESLGEHIMTDAFVQQSFQASPTPATAADVMRPPLTTVEQQGHVAAAAYLMKHAGATALIVLDAQTDQPIGILTEANIAHAVADGKDMNSVRIYELMTTRPTIIKTTTNVRDAAQVMTSGHFRHLPVVGDAGLVGIVDITDVCRALLEPDVSGTPEAVAGRST